MAMMISARARIYKHDVPPLNFAVLGLLDRKLALARAVRNGIP